MGGHQISGVRLSYPWLLAAGDHVWIGEDVWIDNLTTVTVGNHLRTSRGAYLCTGNHDWSDPGLWPDCQADHAARGRLGGGLKRHSALPGGPATQTSSNSTAGSAAA